MPTQSNLLPGRFKTLLSQLVFLALLALCIYMAEGRYGFIPFMNLEAWLIVGGGTLVLTWGSHRPGDDTSMLARTARDRAVATGGIATVLGLILMLASIDDVAAIPRRMALVLAPLFYSLLLSEVVLAPFERAARAETTDTRGRLHIMGMVGLLALFCLMTLLYSLTAALNSNVPSQRQATTVLPSRK